MRKILHAPPWPRQTAQPFVRLLAWAIAVVALSNIAFASYLATMFGLGSIVEQNSSWLLGWLSMRPNACTLRSLDSQHRTLPQ